jgi:tetratricopeptide (TPR) repeat protein
MRRLACLAVVLFLAACSKSREKAPPPQPATAPPPALPATVAREISVTTSSPQALEAFQKGRARMDNARSAEAREHFQKAVELDPKFALAHALLGSATPGEAGNKHIGRALELAAGLPEPERLTIELLHLRRTNQDAKARETLGRLAALAPQDWRVQVMVAGQAFFDRKLTEVVTATRRAADLNPKAGEPYNLMGYALARLGRMDEAIAALKKYAAMKPEEANPRDSLGEILLSDGRFAEAAAELEQAAKLAPKMWIAWEGAAIAHFARGDFASGRAALDRAREAAATPRDKLWIDIDRAKSFQAEGKTEEALRTLDAMEKEARALKEEVRVVWTPWHRAHALFDAGRYDDALKQLDLAFERAAKSGVSKTQHRDLKLRGNVFRLLAQARLKRLEDAKRSVAAIEEVAREHAQNPFFQSALHGVQGELARAQGDLQGALRHFSQCLEEDFGSRSLLADAQEAAGDKAAARATRESVAKRGFRTMFWVTVRAKLAAK